MKEIKVKIKKAIGILLVLILSCCSGFTGTIIQTNFMVFKETIIVSNESSVVSLSPSNIVINGNQVLAVPEIYPVFIIPLGDQWTDFELKGSTNNFTGVGGADLVYYYISSMTNGLNDDRWAIYYFTDSGASDAREWIQGTCNVSIASQLVDTNSIVGQVIFYPSTNTLTGVTTNNSMVWQYEANTNLIWSYTRFDGVDFERDVANRVIWRPIIPVQWATVRKNRFDGGD